MKKLCALLAVALLCPGGASAQNFAGRLGSLGNGITVTGRGAANAAPDRARVSIEIFGNVGPPTANSVPLDDAANAVRDALRAAGVSDAREVLPLGNLSTRNVNPAVVGSVAKPTRDKLEAIARSVIKAIPDRLAPALSNAQIQLSLASDDCGPDEARAERAAFADARIRAARFASIAGLRLGAVTAIVDTQTFLPPPCSAKPDVIEGGPLNGPQFTSPYSPLLIPITVNVTVTFAIAGQ